MKIKKNLEIELTIDKLAFGGKGIGNVDGQVVFVEGGLPGDKLVTRIRKVKKNYVEGRVVRLLEKSRLRQDARCAHFGQCGGCKWQNLDYQHQLDFKRQHVEESLLHLGGVEAGKILPALPSPHIFAYRNKTEFSFTDNRWLTPEELSNPDIKKGFALGFHVPGAFDRVMHIQTCWLQDDTMNRILNFTQQYFFKKEIPVFNLKSHEGLLRFLVLRKSFAYQKYMVNIVTFKPLKTELKEYVSSLIKEFPEVHSVINTVNRRFAQIAFGEEEYCLAGEPVIKEKIGDFEFEISANSFFQTNPLQAKNLYGIVEGYVGTDNRVIWDLYSGTGTIALFLARHASRVTGFELVESAVKDAFENCRKNGVDNCDFIGGDIRDNISGQTEKPDVIVCDPPRSGMHPDVVAAILEAAPAKIVYVSCNPATMARDLKTLVSQYDLEEVQPVDMFPHTYHIESVARLVRKKEISG